ncbi:MAG TPA: DUF2585 family protein [Humisphaera sp.]|jgi:hypothetical protein|nr:DUF2585 family protein [Humisphaera sp.]
MRFIPHKSPSGNSIPTRRRTIPAPMCFAAAAAIMALAAFAEWRMGRLPICKCGHVRLWGAMNTPELSQQIADWYSFSHIIHGLAFYAIIRLISRNRWSLGACLLVAITVEASWEVIENSSFVINRYRHTMSLDYYGDSILNSMCDILFAIGGFFLAAWLPTRVSIALVVVIEVGMALAIRDNLTLNIIMLIHPFQAIKHWQMGASWLPFIPLAASGR